MGLRARGGIAWGIRDQRRHDRREDATDEVFLLGRERRGGIDQPSRVLIQRDQRITVRFIAHASALCTDARIFWIRSPAVLHEGGRVHSACMGGRLPLPTWETPVHHATRAVIRTPVVLPDVRNAGVEDAVVV